jgi:hypothetical protein
MLRECKTAIWQHKRYRYQKNSEKPVKEDDHIPDSTMLCLRKWMLGKPVTNVAKETETERKTSTVTGGLMGMQF